MQMRQEEEEKVFKKPDRRSFKQKSLAEKFKNSVSSPPNDNKDSEGSGMDSSTPEESKMSPERRQEGSQQSSPSDFDKLLLSTESEVSAQADIAENFAEDDQEEDLVKHVDDMRSGLGAQKAEEQKGSDDDSDEDDDDDYDKYLDDIENQL